MTLQEAFSAVYIGLRSQRFRRSMDMWQGCSYRGEDGLKCAFGWLIPDEVYHPTMEFLLLSEIIEKNAVISESLDRLPIIQLQTLQHIHDRNDDPEHMQDDLRTFAMAHGLTVPE